MAVAGAAPGCQNCGRTPEELGVGPVPPSFRAQVTGSTFILKGLGLVLRPITPLPAPASGAKPARPRSSCGGASSGSVAPTVAACLPDIAESWFPLRQPRLARNAQAGHRPRFRPLLQPLNQHALFSAHGIGPPAFSQLLSERVLAQRCVGLAGHPLADARGSVVLNGVLQVPLVSHCLSWLSPAAMRQAFPMPGGGATDRRL